MTACVCQRWLITVTSPGTPWEYTCTASSRVNNFICAVSKKNETAFWARPSASYFHSAINEVTSRMKEMFPCQPLVTAKDALCSRCLFHTPDSPLLSLREFLLASCALDVLLVACGLTVSFWHAGIMSPCCNLITVSIDRSGQIL